MDIVARAKGMILTPEDEWRTIAPERTDMAEIFRGYVAPLAAVAAVGTLLKAVLAGSILGALLGAIVGVILTCVGVFVVAKIIEFLTPQFGGSPDALAALKLAAFAPTASWIAQALSFIPAIGWLITLAGGLYSLYVYYLGAPVVARVAPDKALIFTISVIVAAVVVYAVIGMIAGAVLLAFIR